MQNLALNTKNNTVNYSVVLCNRRKNHLHLVILPEETINKEARSNVRKNVTKEKRPNFKEVWCETEKRVKEKKGTKGLEIQKVKQRFYKKKGMGSCPKTSFTQNEIKG